MADRPLRPATDRRLGGLLPHQLANQASAALIARGLAIPRFLPWDVCGISLDFSRLSPITGYVPMYYSPVRHSTQELPPFRVRLACVKHAASVQSEPGSNSSVQSFSIVKRLLQPAELSLHQLHSLKVIARSYLLDFGVSLGSLHLYRDTLASHASPSAHTYRLFNF